jgi:hypothetical protein
MSAMGQKETFALQKRHVRFTPKSGHVRCNSPCLLWANSGHQGLRCTHHGREPLAEL